MCAGPKMAAGMYLEHYLDSKGRRGRGRGPRLWAAPAGACAGHGRSAARGGAPRGPSSARGFTGPPGARGLPGASRAAALPGCPRPGREGRAAAAATTRSHGRAMRPCRGVSVPLGNGGSGSGGPPGAPVRAAPPLLSPPRGPGCRSGGRWAPLRSVR